MSQLAALVNKLGHRLEEIRVRALQSIVDKLNYGLVTEEQLADKEYLFENLIKWFNQEKVPAKDDVLKLILRILKQQPDAGVLLQKADPGLARLRELTDSDVLVTDIINLALKQVNSARYNSGGSRPPDTARTWTSDSTKQVGAVTGCSKISSYQPSGRSDVRLMSEYQLPYSGRSEVQVSNSSEMSNTVESKSISSRPDVPSKTRQVLWVLPHVSLVSTDQSILTSIKDSLISSSSASKTCHFFSSVMLHDFPPEVFLQNPAIIRVLLKLTEKAGPTSDAAVHCLHIYIKTLHSRLLFCSHVEYTSLKTFGSEEEAESDTGQSSDSPRQHYQQEGYVSSGSERQTSGDSEDPLTFPQFCLLVLIHMVELVGQTQLASPMVTQALRLWKAVVPDPTCVWRDKDGRNTALLHQLGRSLLHTVTKKIKQSVCYEPIRELHVMSASLHIVESLVPVELAADVLPDELQDIIGFSLVDPVLVINCPTLHCVSLKYANVLKRKDMTVYNEVLRVRTALEAAVKFSREAATLPPSTALDLLTTALPALPLLPDHSIICQFTQYVVERRDMSEDEISQAAQLARSLLAHSDKAVMAEAYRVFHKLVTSLLGPHQALSDVESLPRLRFLVDTAVLQEIVSFGATNPDNQVRQNAEDILVYILKCERLVGTGPWRGVLEQLSPVLPLLQCHASLNTVLGRTLLHLLDPDVAASASLSPLQVLCGNLRLLLHKEPHCREEGAARLIWLTGLRHLPHNRLADVCLIDVAITNHTPVTGMYEAGSVVRVLELLAGPCVEARVRQSAMTQISVMTEDPRLHQVFIDQQGVELFISILQNVGEEMNKEDGGCVTPIVATMKHLARHNAGVRQTLSQHEQFLISVTKSLFQVREWRLQRDATQLLALLVYADVTLSSPAGLSLPQLVTQTACLPFPCNAHWTVSPHTVTSLKGVVLGNKVVERLLAAQWAVLTDGLDSVLRLSDLPSPPPDGPLTLTLRVLRQLQHSHVTHNCRRLLHDFQNSTSHHAAHQALTALSWYLELGWLADADTLSKLPWKATFRRFLLSPPSSEEDFTILLLVLKFIHFMLGEVEGQGSWVSEALLTPPHCLLRIILPASSARHNLHDMWKKVCLWLLSVCQLCVQETPLTVDWQPLVQLLYQSLHYSQTLPSYTLELLGSELGCLVAVVSKPATEKDSAALWQLLSSFNCDPAAHIFMGLGITRLTIIGLNKLLSLIKDKESWLGQRNLEWLPGLWTSRDVLVRASALQLLAGLSCSPRGAVTVLNLTPDFFYSVLRIVVDHKEASLVREHGALLLTNVLAHSSNKEFASTVQKSNFYQEFRETISLLALVPASTHTEATTGMMQTTPQLVRAGCWFLYNLMAQSPDAVKQALVSSGLTTSLCRLLSETDKVSCACAVSGSVSDMFAAICRLLAVCCGSCEPALLQDTLPTIAGLLNSTTFSNGSELGTEVRSLWRECLRLLAAALPMCPSQFVLPPAAVLTLTYCLSDSDHLGLVLTALHAIPALVNHVTPKDERSLCSALLTLWPGVGKVKTALLAALSALLGRSATATQTAMDSGLMASIITTLRQLHLTLTVQTNSTDKLTKNNPLMLQLSQLVTLVNNLLHGSDVVRRAAADLGLADIVHKVWAWCQADMALLHLTLDLLITFTADCPPAAQSLVLTSSVTGVTQRKSPSPHSLLHALLALLTREQLSPPTRSKTLRLLSHSCQAHHCRTVIAKSALLTKWGELWCGRKPLSEQAELSWLRFVLVFTYFPEGQNAVPKATDVFSQLVECAGSGRPSCRPLAFSVLRNLTASQVNRTRFLGTKSLLILVREKLLSGSTEERRDAALVVWALSANQQKAKIQLRGLGLLSALELAAATSTDNIFPTVAALLKPS